MAAVRVLVDTDVRIDYFNAGEYAALLDLVLPADPRVRDLRVTPHALSAYDALLTPPPAAEPACSPRLVPDGAPHQPVASVGPDCPPLA